MSIQLITFTIAGGVYGIEVVQVEETLGHLNRTPVPLAPPGVAGLVNLRGQVVTAIDVRPKLGLPPLDPNQESMMVVIDMGDESMSQPRRLRTSALNAVRRNPRTRDRGIQATVITALNPRCQSSNSCLTQTTNQKKRYQGGHSCSHR